MKRTTAAIVGTAMLFGAGGAAMAAQHGNDAEASLDLAKAASAKVSLAQAVDAAQKAAGGNAVEAGLTDEAGQGGWEIELAQVDGTMKRVLVDVTSGAVDQNLKMENEKKEQSGAADREDSKNGEEGEGGE
ncbi:PepSY domain-containing protein [Aurantimonas marina]|uniref:PepSY domain-containing protein n=1 Tax=Aurantimonas marina TaxID=2780508 RepID=UPI0019CF5B7A|nr:PepSY domain-containing protein [Aurantimonas marina]